MMGAVFAEMDKEWVGRRSFNDDSIGRAAPNCHGKLDDMT